MPFKSDERRRRYMRQYMRERYWLEKAFEEAAGVRVQRQLERKGLRRVWEARRKAETGGAIDPRELSLGWQWNEIAQGR